VEIEVGEGSGGKMFRTIAAAAIVFAFAAFAMKQSSIGGPLEEPLLLLFMGMLFLVVGRLFSAEGRKTLLQREA
jgi:hypothetical protein